MSFKLPLTLALLVALCACDRSSTPSNTAQPPTTSAASQETGAVAGIVRLDGDLPAPAQLPTNDAVRRRCGESVTDPSLVVGSAGALRGAIVSLVDAPSSNAPPKDVLLDQKGCVFIPSVIAAQAGATLIIKNSDPLTHNVRAIREKGDLFNVAMPLEGMTMKRVLPTEPGLVQLHCDIHPWMNGVLKTYAHPFFAQTDADGRFRIEGVPAGRHTFEIWHPRLPARRIELTVPARGEVTQDVRFASQELTAGVGAAGPL